MRCGLPHVPHDKVLRRRCTAWPLGIFNGDVAGCKEQASWPGCEELGVQHYWGAFSALSSCSVLLAYTCPVGPN